VYPAKKLTPTDVKGKRFVETVVEKRDVKVRPSIDTSQ
jgi:hypothetical protein